MREGGGGADDTDLYSSLCPYATTTSLNCRTTSSAAAFMRSIARRSLGFAKSYLFENLRRGASTRVREVVSLWSRVSSLATSRGRPWHDADVRRKRRARAPRWNQERSCSRHRNRDCHTRRWTRDNSLAEPAPVDPHHDPVVRRQSVPLLVLAHVFESMSAVNVEAQSSFLSYTRHTRCWP